MDKAILTTTEAAKLLGVSVRTAQLLIEGGSLTSWKTPGGHRRVNRADVLALKARDSSLPAISSARIFLVASPERLPLLEKQLSGMKGYSVDSYSDIYSASFALGLRQPAVVIVDLKDKNRERPAFLRRLVTNPNLAETRIIVIGEFKREARSRKGADSLIHLAHPRSIADAIQSIQTSPYRIVVPMGSDFPVAANEAQRLLALENAGLVNTLPEDVFDRLTWLAQRTLDAPIALFTLITRDHQWFKSRQGLDLFETPRSWAICNYTILQRDVFAVDDLLRDARFSGNPAVAGPPNFRFYAGAPVLDRNGFALGSLCVIDYNPRTLDQEQMETLRTLAVLTSEAVQLRAANRQLRWALDALEHQNR
jgi:excisionase family DNA binding protein